MCGSGCGSRASGSYDTNERETELWTTGKVVACPSHRRPRLAQLHGR